MNNIQVIDVTSLIGDMTVIDINKTKYNTIFRTRTHLTTLLYSNKKGVLLTYKEHLLFLDDKYFDLSKIRNYPIGSILAIELIPLNTLTSGFVHLQLLDHLSHTFSNDNAFNKCIGIGDLVAGMYVITTVGYSRVGYNTIIYCTSDFKKCHVLRLPWTHPITIPYIKSDGSRLYIPDPNNNRQEPTITINVHQYDELFNSFINKI